MKKNLHSIYSFYNVKARKKVRFLDKAKFFSKAESEYKYISEIKDYDGTLSAKFKRGYERYKFTPGENLSLWEKVITFFKSKKDSIKKYKATQTILNDKTKKPVKFVKDINKKNKVFKVKLEKNKEYQKKSIVRTILNDVILIFCLFSVFCMGIFFNDIISYIQKNFQVFIIIFVLSIGIFISILLITYLNSRKNKESKRLNAKINTTDFIIVFKKFFFFAVPIFIMGLNYKNLYQNIGITIGISIFVYFIIIYLKRRFGSGSVILYAKEHKFLKKLERKLQCQVARILKHNIDKTNTLILRFYLRIYTKLLWFSESFYYEIFFNLKLDDYQSWKDCIRKKKDNKTNILEYKKKV